MIERCSVCHGLLDEEDLFCANCGAEAPAAERPADHNLTLTHNFDCRGCGASMSYDASAQTLRCPFCGSEKLDAQPETKTLAPNRVAHFQIDRKRAQSILRQWLGKGFWRPADLSRRAVVTKITPVLVPYWVFQASTHTYWTADTSETPFGARGDWAPMSGEHRKRYNGLLVGASGSLKANETSAICPFDLAAATPPARADLENVVVEQFRVQRKYARPLARQGLEESERTACAMYVPGRARNVKVNVRLQGLSSEPVLLPVWIMAYRYKEEVFRFLINGQNGRATGRAPVSYAGLIKILAIIAAVVFAMFAGLAIVAGIASTVR